MKDTNNQDKSFQERLAEAEERRKNETISDIIVAKRREADSIEASARGSFKAGEDWDEMPFTESDLESALDLAETKRKEADRLEAALRRELSKIASKNVADFGQLGDAAREMRYLASRLLREWQDAVGSNPKFSRYGCMVRRYEKEFGELVRKFDKEQLTAIGDAAKLREVCEKNARPPDGRRLRGRRDVHRA